MMERLDKGNMMNRQPLYRMTTRENGETTLHIHFSDKLRRDHFNRETLSLRIFGSNEAWVLESQIRSKYIQKVLVYGAVRDEDGIIHEDEEPTRLELPESSMIWSHEWSRFMDRARALGPNNRTTEERPVPIKTVAFTGATILEW